MPKVLRCRLRGTLTESAQCGSTSTAALPRFNGFRGPEMLGTGSHRSRTRVAHPEVDQALGTLVTPLVTRGLVLRSRAGNKLAHSLTDSGRELLAVTEATVTATLEKRMAALAAKEIDNLWVLLERIA